MRIPELSASARGASSAVAILASLLAGCDGPDALGVAASAQGVGYCITNVHTDVPTIHFRGQRWLIAAAEGLGPRDLDVDVTEFAQPQISTNTSFKPGVDDISNAVGYSVTTRYQVSASSRVTVNTGVFDRLEAYIAFQRAVWEIRDAGCGVHLGVGASYKPVGVYFQTVEALDLGIQDPGVYALGPDCIGPTCLPVVPPPGQGAPPPGGAPTPASDTGGEGAPDGGAADGG
jgi:hypothetical protein